MTLLWCLLSCALFAQLPPPPPPPPPPGATVVPMTGTAAVRVTVVSETTGRPVKGADVLAVVETGTNTFTRSGITDRNGRTWLLGIAKGRVRVSASHPAYIGSYSATAEPGDVSFSWIPIADGQDLDLRLKMRRGAVIAGAVLDDNGDPMPGVEVGAYLRDVSGGAPRFVRFSIDQTDDRGAYRLTNLPPGSYVVGIVPRYAEGSFPVEEFARFDADAAARESPGTVPTDAVLPIADGRAVRLVGSSPAPVVLHADGTARGYATTFYPTATTPARAAVITMGAAEIRSAIDLRLEPVSLTRISGVVSGPDGDVAATQLLLKAADDSSGFLEGRFNAEPGERGEFGFSFVPAGRYTIDALRRPTSEKPALAANVPLVVESGTPRDDVEVRLAPGPRFAGRVQLAAGEPSGAGELSRYSIVLIPLRPISPASFIPRRQSFGEDGRFDLPAILPGDYVAQVIGFDAKTLFASSLMVDGRDVLDSWLTLTAGRDVTDAVITLASRRAEVTGFVRNAANVTTSDGYVIAFSTDRTLWTSTRRTTGVRPDTDGQYRIPTLPPGDYYFISTDALAGQWRDPAFLDTLVARAERVTIKEGEALIKDLKRR
ncbi:MAG TPA: carboxypeptidase-like regulatory domain-containing protein [Vicinamibacterales bacterium]|nr:carboxypeptidase-like regulatory domain-containing protein [Vicinamibacterales bacterium]